MKLSKLFAIISAITVMLCFSVSVSADIGPKPSIHIEFLNMPEGECFGTLLSKNDTTGPSSVWDGNKEHAQHNENEYYNYSWAAFDYATWLKFVEYDDPDGFYFLQEGWNIAESDGIHWTYYPPQEFKILLYFPETGEFITSGIYERYAFDSYFTVDMSTVGLIAPENAVILDHVNPDTGDYGISADKLLLADRSYDYSSEIIGLIVRVILTVLIELAVALPFMLLKKKYLKVLAFTNIVTQLLLNLFLNISAYFMGGMGAMAVYILLEIAVFSIEAAIYTHSFKRYGKHKGIYYIAYALVANGTSFFLGVWLASLLPELF